MSRLTPIPWRVLECIILAAGFRFSRQSGGHRIYTKQDCIRPIIIPAHGKNLAVTVIQSNLRTAEISRRQYFELIKDCQ